MTVKETQARASRQATKGDLEWVAEELGISFRERPTVAEVRAVLRHEFQRLHTALGGLHFGEPGLGRIAKALYAAAGRSAVLTLAPAGDLDAGTREEMALALRAIADRLDTGASLTELLPAVDNFAGALACLLSQSYRDRGFVNAPTDPETLMTGAERIAAERKRQIDAEGYTAAHDDEHDGGEIALAAALYATPWRLYEKHEHAAGVSFADAWPWEGTDSRPFDGNVIQDNDSLPRTERIRMLEKAGALIAAEIDRLLRIERRHASRRARKNRR